MTPTKRWLLGTYVGNGSGSTLEFYKHPPLTKTDCTIWKSICPEAMGYYKKQSFWVYVTLNCWIVDLIFRAALRHLACRYWYMKWGWADQSIRLCVFECLVVPLWRVNNWKTTEVWLWPKPSIVKCLILIRWLPVFRLMVCCVWCRFVRIDELAVLRALGLATPRAGSLFLAVEDAGARCAVFCFVPPVFGALSFLFFCFFGRASFVFCGRIFEDDFSMAFVISVIHPRWVNAIRPELCLWCWCSYVHEFYNFVSKVAGNIRRIWRLRPWISVIRKHKQRF